MWICVSLPLARLGFRFFLSLRCDLTVRWQWTLESCITLKTRISFGMVCLLCFSSSSPTSHAELKDILSVSRTEGLSRIDNALKSFVSFCAEYDGKCSWLVSDA